MIEVWPVVHVLNREQTLRCAAVAAGCGCPGVFLISMHGDDDEIDRFAPMVGNAHPGLKIGANYLTMEAAEAVIRSQRLGYAATWTDRQEFTGGDVTEHGCWMLAVRRGHHQIFAAVAFKGQPIDSTPGASAMIAANCGVVPTTSGERTGSAPDVQKIRHIRERMRQDQPLAIASGVTPQNVASFAPFVTHVLVSTGISRTFHEFDEGKLRDLMMASA